MITFTVNYVRLCQLDGSWVQNESSCDLCHSWCSTVDSNFTARSHTSAQWACDTPIDTLLGETLNAHRRTSIREECCSEAEREREREWPDAKSNAVLLTILLIIEVALLQNCGNISTYHSQRNFSKFVWEVEGRELLNYKFWESLRYGTTLLIGPKIFNAIIRIAHDGELKSMFIIHKSTVLWDAMLGNYEYFTWTFSKWHRYEYDANNSIINR
jgi:hypothetical protein